MPGPALRRIYWCIVFALGLLQGWTHRFQVDHDGVNYLDVAENYARGDWKFAVNGYWSPLYSWLLAVGKVLFHIPRMWESTFLHLINFLAYLSAYACFELLLKDFLLVRSGARGDQGLGKSAWQLLGVSLFLYSSLYMSNHGGSTPDILLTIFVYLATAFLLRIYSDRASANDFLCFGAALGLGYFAKTAMFVVSLFFLAAAAMIMRSSKNRLHFLYAVLSFVVLAGSWMAVLSAAKGRFAYGDSGRLAYTRHVQPQAVPFAWSGETEPGANLAHPPRRIGDSPPIIEFATPLPATFPLWYDAGYWLEGNKMHFSWKGQLRVLVLSANSYLEILRDQREYLVLLLMLAFCQISVLAYFRRVAALWPILIPQLAALALYALVLVEARYVSAFMVVTWLTFFASVKVSPPDTELLQRLARYCVLAAVMVSAIVLLKGAIVDVRAIFRGTVDEQRSVAVGLREIGLPNGSFVSLIGTSRDSFEWARLANLRIVSLVPNERINEYWFGSSETQLRVSRSFAETGARAIITDEIPTGANTQGWRRIGQTPFSIYQIPSAASGAAGTGAAGNAELQSSGKNAANQ